MKNRKKLIIIGSIILATILTIIGVLIYNGSLVKSDVEDIAPLETIEPGAEPTDIPEPTEFTPQKEGAEAEEAVLLFPDVEAMEHFTKQEVQLALLTSSNYINRAMSTPYFADGSFEEEGLLETKAAEYFAQYFTPAAWSDFVLGLQDREATFDNGKEEFINQYMGLVYFPNLRGADPADWLPEGCRLDSLNEHPSVGEDVISNCFSGVQSTSDPKYFESEDGEHITFEANATVNPIFFVDEKRGFRPTTIVFKLYLEKNLNADWANEIPSMVISGFSNTAEWESWREINE